jgi:hypothetical protein
MSGTNNGGTGGGGLRIWAKMSHYVRNEMKLKAQ